MCQQRLGTALIDARHAYLFTASHVPVAPPSVCVSDESPQEHGLLAVAWFARHALHAGLGGMGAAGRMAAHVASFNSVDVPGPWHVHGDRGELSCTKQCMPLLAQGATCVHARCRAPFCT